MTLAPLSIIRGQATVKGMVSANANVVTSFTKILRNNVGDNAPITRLRLSTINWCSVPCTSSTVTINIKLFAPILARLG